MRPRRGQRDHWSTADTWLTFAPTGIEVRMGRVGIQLEYPFPLSELYEVIAELEVDFENDIERTD